MKGVLKNSSCFLFFALIVSVFVPVTWAGIAVGVSIDVAPPPLPVYDQPMCPGPDYIWTPGYWAYGPDGYYWVPGVWVPAPAPYLLWTPGYWGWSDGFYAWHGGYWGRHVGFYGGVNYGHGYGGVGFVGGSWRGRNFSYNRAVTNVNVAAVHNTYVAPVPGGRAAGGVSFNGGAGGIAARPTVAELAAVHEQHVQPTARQVRHEQLSRSNRAFLASVNHGQPPRSVAARHGPAGPATGGRSAASAVHGRAGMPPSHGQASMPHGPGAPAGGMRNGAPGMHGQARMAPHGQMGAPHGAGHTAPQHAPQQPEHGR